jgi:hypothetical protein
MTLDCSSITGVKIEMPRPCKCRAPVAQITAKGELKCTSCARHRGWLQKEIADMLLWSNETFGTLDRRCVHIRIRKNGEGAFTDADYEKP